MPGIGQFAQSAAVHIHLALFGGVARGAVLGGGAHCAGDDELCGGGHGVLGGAGSGGVAGPAAHHRASTGAAPAAALRSP